MLLNQSINDLQEIANKLAHDLNQGDVVLLSGDLGAGKTTFSKLLCHSLGVEESQVTSPTFNLMHIYKSQDKTIFHYDLYRLNSAHEFKELGFDEFRYQGISIVEWADKYHFEDGIKIHINFSKESPDLRDIEISYI